METANKLRDRLNQAMPLLAGAAFVLVLGVTAIGVLCSGTVALPPGETCAQCVREWIGALSGWFAGLVGVFAVGAALLTVATIREQIEAAREDSLRISNQAKEIINNKLYNIFSSINVGWRYLDCHFDKNLDIDHKTCAYRLARVEIRESIKTHQLEKIGELLIATTPVDRELIKSILQSLRHILEITPLKKRDEADNIVGHENTEASNDTNSLDELGIYLSHLAKNVEKYDKNLCKIFEERVHYPVNHDPLWKIREKNAEDRISSWKQRSGAGS